MVPGRCKRRVAAREESTSFLKREEKTFALWPTRPPSTRAAYANWQKFFASFFQKRSAVFLLRKTRRRVERLLEKFLKR
jgi:hypothetical protein